MKERKGSLLTKLQSQSLLFLGELTTQKPSPRHFLKLAIKTEVNFFLSAPTIRNRQIANMC